jgi:hypothetical protein
VALDGATRLLLKVVFPSNGMKTALDASSPKACRVVTSGSSWVVYLMMSFNTQKCYRDHASRTLLLNALGPGPLELRLRSSQSSHPPRRGLCTRCSDCTPTSPPTGLMVLLGLRLPARMTQSNMGWDLGR